MKTEYLRGMFAILLLSLEFSSKEAPSRPFGQQTRHSDSRTTNILSNSNDGDVFMGTSTSRLQKKQNIR